MRENWTAGRLLEVSGSYWQTCALHAGVKLGIFTALGRSQLTAEDVAQRTASSLRGTAALLNALTAMGLLARDGDRYRNTDESWTYLVEESKEYIGYMILHHHHLMESWARMPAAVRGGRPIRKRSTFRNREVRESFLMGMFNLASRLAPMIVSEVDLTGRKHLLDLGGGPGTYAIHFCGRYEGLRATVFDLKTTRPFARKTIRRFGMGDRIAFRAGNYLEDALGDGYDAAWLSHILHGEGPEDCRKIVSKAAASLEPGRPRIHPERYEGWAPAPGPVFPQHATGDPRGALLLGLGDPGHAHRRGPPGCLPPAVPGPQRLWPHRRLEIALSSTGGNSSRAGPRTGRRGRPTWWRSRPSPRPALLYRKKTLPNPPVPRWSQTG